MFNKKILIMIPFQSAGKYQDKKIIRCHYRMINIIRQQDYRYKKKILM